ncbi:MAG: hypothetical protein ACR2N5_08720 [Solirubrobacterales bacterium]
MAPGSPPEDWSAFFASEPLGADEWIVDSWAGSKARMGLSMHGGNLILTNRRLIFQPLKAPKVSAKVWSAPLDQIASLEHVERKGKLKPARVDVTTKDGRKQAFIVLFKRISAAWDKQHDEAAAQAAQAISAAAA